MPSQSVEEYLEAIYRLGGETGVVSTGQLAERLGVAPPSVTTMLGRLDRDGLVKHIRYHGFSLTSKGLELAASLLRRHRLSERLLTDILGISWDKVHDPACKLEHIITGEIEERAYEVLGEPERCPHGSLLEGSEVHNLTLLCNVPANESVRIVKVDDEGEEFLKQAAALGLTPSANVTVLKTSGSTMHLQVGDKNIDVEPEITRLIWCNSTEKTI